ncbi:MAG: sensor domain-containing diguanylate cyclase [Dehalococcoidia bacterium]|nr:sensor domain-containing diguanylate cyclase [Dehalococcoidia bacterium]
MTGIATKEELRRLTAIARIHHSVGLSVMPEEVSRILVRELSEVLKCNGCAILLIEGKQVRVLAERGFFNTLGQVEFNTDMPAIRHILDTAKTIVTGDVANSPAADCLPEKCSVRSLICIPIMVNNEVRGIIHIDSMKNDAFTKEDAEFIELLADEVAISIERSLIYSRVVDLSIKDGLIGCFNRRKFDVDIVANFAHIRQYGGTLALLMLDVDWFKLYNDFHGHADGDTLLKKLVATLANNVRPMDRVYRYGGEEFTVILPETDRDSAFLIARRLQRAVELEPFKGESQSQPRGRVTVSIGVAGFPMDASDRNSLLKAADAALYRAKQSGRNRVCNFHPSAEQTSN